MVPKKYKPTLLACCLTSASSAIPNVLSPLLFTTFHKVYGISYTLLGFLVVLNFATQLLIDLIYSFFSGKLNLKLSVKLTSGAIFGGLFLYALSPVLFPGAPYIGLALGTVIFSAGSGLAEVLTSPVVTAIPSDDPDKTLSLLHSGYAWGLLIIVIGSGLFLSAVGSERWQLLTLVLSALPLVTFILMLLSPIPALSSQENVAADGGVLRNRTALLFVVCIFFAGAAELTMCQWCSGYLETTFAIPKALGDLVGLALYAAALTVGRTLYTRRGGDIDKVLIFGSLGATVCYAAAAISSSPVVGLIACALSGFFVAMLWPGSLIAVTKRIPNAGVNLFAMMAVGGDLGGTFYPQLVGIITDAVSGSARMTALGGRLGLGSEQFGMKVGMLFAVLAPLGAVLFFTLASRIPAAEKET